MRDETNDLMKTLVWTISLIADGDLEQKQRISRAYLDAQDFIATIDIADGSARPRIVACLERFETYKAAEDVEAAGWMLMAIQQRVEERDLRDWEVMDNAIQQVLKLLPSPTLQ